MGNLHHPDRRPLCPVCQKNTLGVVGSKTCHPCYAKARSAARHNRPLTAREQLRPTPWADSRPIAVRLVEQLQRSPLSLRDLAVRLGVTLPACRAAIKTAVAGGRNIQIRGSEVELERTPAVGGIPIAPLVSTRAGQHLIGWTSDNHLCSKQQRLDVLHDLYDKFADAGVTTVLNAGNYIDGEFRFNKHELLVHGMEAQVDYLVEHYPHRKGITTMAVSGDDHEGWYCQREGVNIGRFVEGKMRAAGREDWRDLGYMEAYVPLAHAVTKQTAQYLVMHPGGGSAYATSYTVQKIVESLEGGEKPAVLQAGHYHKMEFINVRNVWVVQSGCTQDQTTFMRKKRLYAAVGGGLLWLQQDPLSGAILGATAQMFQYFNRGFQNGRWSLSGPVQQVARHA